MRKLSNVGFEFTQLFLLVASMAIFISCDPAPDHSDRGVCDKDLKIEEYRTTPIDSEMTDNTPVKVSLLIVQSRIQEFPGAYLFSATVDPQSEKILNFNLAKFNDEQEVVWSKEYSVCVLEGGVVLFEYQDGDNNYQIINIQLSQFDKGSGGTLTLDYLTNGLFDSRAKSHFQILNVGGKWQLYYHKTNTDNLTTFNTVILYGNYYTNPFSDSGRILVGISKIQFK